MRRLGLVVHPVREIDRALEQLEDWARARDVDLVQLRAPGQRRDVAPQGDAAECDLLMAIGGDGTVLAAIRAGSMARRPVLGVACGSLGALATVAIDGLESALERFGAGSWTPVSLPALAVAAPGGAQQLAFNDLVAVRAAAGQVAVTVHVDDVLYGAFAGDGVIASTQLGSSAYALAAGGPLLLAGSRAYELTPLAAHGGSLPPIVIGADSRLRIEVDGGHVATRVELDGQTTELGGERTEAGGLQFAICLQPDRATLVRFGDEETYLAGLRRRRIVLDSPRMYVREARMKAAGPTPAR
jgi:NAD+ kinase